MFLIANTKTRRRLVPETVPGNDDSVCTSVVGVSSALNVSCLLMRTYMYRGCLIKSGRNRTLMCSEHRRLRRPWFDQRSLIFLLTTQWCALCPSGRAMLAILARGSGFVRQAEGGNTCTHAHKHIHIHIHTHTIQGLWYLRSQTLQCVLFSNSADFLNHCSTADFLNHCSTTSLLLSRSLSRSSFLFLLQTELCRSGKK